MDHVLVQEQARTKRLLRIMSVIYGIIVCLTWPFFLMMVGFSLPFLFDPKKRADVIPVFFVALVPHLCVAGITVGWMYYVRGAFRKARKATWISIASICLFGFPLLAPIVMLIARLLYLRFFR